MQIRHVLAGVLAAILGAAGVAGAQDIPDPRSDAQIRLGPLYVTPRLAIEELGVDTNVFNNASEKRDFTATLAPHADLWVPFGRRALLSTAATVDLVYYQAYSSERSVNPEVRVRGEGFLGRIRPFAEASYLSSRRRPNFEIDARSRREERAVRIGASVRVGPRLSFELSGRQADVAYDADAEFNDIRLRETLNRETKTASLDVRYALTPLTTLILRTQGGNERYEFSPIRNADTYRVTPGVEFDPVALISGSAFVGYRRYSPLSSALEPFNGIVAVGTLSCTLLGTTRFTVDVERDLLSSYERFQPYFVLDGYGLTVRRQLVGRTDITVGFQRHKYSYRDLVLPGALPTDIGRVDRTRTWSASFGYRLGQSTRAGIGLLHRSRESTSVRFRDYSGFRFMTSLTYEL